MTEVVEARVTSNIIYQFDANSTESDVVLFQNLLQPLKTSFGITETTVHCSAFIEELYAYAETPNLPEAPPSDISEDDSLAVQQQKALALQWKSPRIHLGIKLTGGIQAWNPTVDLQNPYKVGMHSILNNAGYPYTRYRPLDLLTDNLMRKLGLNSKLVMSLINVGSGLLKSNDIITIEGTVTQEVVVFKQLIPRETNNFTSLVTTTRRTLIEANSNRNHLIISNVGNAPILYKLGDNVTTANYDAQIAVGADASGVASYKGIVTVMTSSGNGIAFAKEYVS